MIAGVVAQSDKDKDCACCTHFHGQFDFWIGEWVVYDTLGKQVGENKIEKLEDGCILSERWVGASGGTGRSYNYYDDTDRSWHQVWIDNKGQNLVLKGSGGQGRMSMQSELIKGKKVDFYANRITWEKRNDGSVIQTWDLVDEFDRPFKVVFKGIYKPKPPEEEKE